MGAFHQAENRNGPAGWRDAAWYMEKNIGIQKFQDDPSLSTADIARIAAWADSGAPQGNPADLPPPRTSSDSTKWAIGEPDVIDIDPNDPNQQLHAYTVLNQNIKILSFEPHLHAPGKRMCLEAIWGYNIQTLNCVGYDHNWVRGYNYTDESAPLLPRGTILHIIGYMDNSPSNKNVPDSRNWQGSGNRSVANMFIDLGARVSLTDDQFKEEMLKRRAHNPRTDVILGCPLCFSVEPPTSTANQRQ